MTDLIKIPAKTFITGEYLALKTRKACVVLTAPVFQFRVVREKTSVDAFHPQSPAGQYIQKHLDFFKNFQWEYIDPYEGVGGMGASTAQFLAVHYFKNQHHFGTDYLEKLLNDYHECAYNGKGYKPSGLDLLAQYIGKINVIKMPSVFWPFESLSFYIVRTGIKVTTHEHLKNVTDFDESELEKYHHLVESSIMNIDEEALIEGVRGYYQSLKKLHWVHSNTIALIEQIENMSPLLAAKGCGALGADTLFLLFQKKDKYKIKNSLNSLNLKIVASEDDIVGGLEMVKCQ